MKTPAHIPTKKQTKEKIKTDELKNVSGGSAESRRRRDKLPSSPLRPGE